jgi:hydrocephalus-inducing protein
LKLSATAAGPERGVSFTVPLGSAETKKVTFRHFLEEPATFAARWRGGGNGGAFVSAEKHDAPGATTLDERNEGLEQHIDVTFEPTSIGSQFRDVLLLTSETGGEYVVPVSGRCVAPKPRGPIAVSASGGASVAFKNPFDAETTFACVADNPAVIVTRSETIGAKQTKQINVRFEPQESGNTVQTTRTAKLLVSSDRCPGAPWAFYLKAAD